MDASGESSSANSTPPPTLEGQREHQQHRHHRHHHHHREDNKGGHPRRHSHKPTQQIQKPSLPRQNPALSALSDTELEYQTPRTAKASQDAEWSWGWGSLPVKNESMESIADAEQKGQHSRHVSIDIPTAPKPVLNEIEIEGETYRVAISLCPGDDFGKDVVASEALFATNQVSFEEFGKDPLKILNNKSLVCLINDRYFTWAAAGPYLASLILFRKPLSDETLHQLSAKDSRHLSDRSQTQEQPTRFSALSRWLRGSPTANQLSAIEQGRGRRPSGSDETLHTQQLDEEEADEKETKPKSGPQLHLGPDKEPMTRSTSMPIQNSNAAGLDDKDTDQAATPEPEYRSMKRYAKTLRLTSDQLKSLNLKKGSNTLTFSVTSSYQGKAVCSAKLFLWDHDYQVVISDIDGTITKSDALGHIFTMAGKDWTHTGVAKLYTDIANNGYHILYLTSRAIGQADYTRKYLKNVEQDNYQLPDGPVIMSPDRLMTAFHREVIMRKPEEFKMACLRDIRRLFEDRNPFYAGFGNRITDALSYRSVNVPSSRIFTIDSGGEIKLELLSSYKSSYLALNDLVNEIFPGKIHAPEFNDWNFWKPSMPMIDLPLAPSPQPTLPSNPVNHGSGGTPGRLNVIRSFTSSLTSSGSLKKRPSIPTFSSSPGLASSPLSSHTMIASTPSPPLPPSSAPAGLQIADRTRRLSLSLMKYGGSHSASASATHVATLSTTQITNGQMSSSPPSSSSENLAAPHQSARSRGMSMTTLSSPVYVPSNLGTSPPTTSSTLSDVHPLDIPTVKKASSFSVSPPQLASRLSETVIPFLRGRSSRPEQGQQQPDVDPSVPQHDQILPSTDDYSESTITEYQEEDEYEGYSGDHYDAGEGGEYEEYEYGDEEEMMDGDLEDDELNIDAPFL
ncbi:MAG: Lipin/Ned1/Smp2-domain-containing protein [Linnemannia gamsii]|nr:MAG: Lipin/Ned1/Smp2-domain-containing protein [Linnemannia gamsii]